MFGNNARFKKGFVEAPYLVVNDVFVTIQGEGPLAGTPALFIRLAECNLACTFCDTEFEKGIKCSPQELMSTIRQVDSLNYPPVNYSLVVITGGEPLLQDMDEFIHMYLSFNPSHTIQIETAGTVWQNKLDAWCETGKVQIVVSPKTPTVHEKVHRYAIAWKYIVKPGWISDDDGLPDVPTQPGLTKRIKLARPDPVFRSRIFVQAVDEQDEDKNRTNTLFAAELAMRYNYRVSLQLHKILALP